MDNDIIVRGVTSQLIAGLNMLKNCIDRCPSNLWNETHNDYPFSQVIYHTLFDCDYHFSNDINELKNQVFHKNNKEIFADYEELDEIIAQRLFERNFIISYYNHCCNKVPAIIETNKNDLTIPGTDVRKTVTKLERYLNTLRHIQHHAAQLGLRLQFATGIEMKWIARGYDS